MKWRQTIALSYPLRELRPACSDQSEALTAQADADRRAYERGAADGERRLSEQLLRQRAELLELQQGVLTSLRLALPQVVRHCETALVELALEVAKKLVSDLPISAGMVEQAIRSALAQAEQSAELEVYLHEDDLKLLKKCNSPVLLPGPGNEAVHFRPSPEVSRGGCVVHTRFGVLDAQRETKLALIRQSLEL